MPVVVPSTPATSTPGSSRGASRRVSSAQPAINTVTPAYPKTITNALPIDLFVQASTPSSPMCFGIRPGRSG